MADCKINFKEELIDYAQSKGSHFFDADSMRFFRSRILETIALKGDFVYFLTSEQFASRGNIAPRKYTIRRLDLMSTNANIETVGEFGEYQTSYLAKMALKELTASKE